jgi:ATP-dependent DNA helicase RecQ
MANVDRLSAMPLFLRHQDFWARVLDPKTHLVSNPKHRDLSFSAGSHRWHVATPETPAYTPSRTQLGLIDIAQSILERGVWTAPSWHMEEHLADLFGKNLGWEIKPLNPERGTLGFAVAQSIIDDAFKQALVTARWQAEAKGATVDDLWSTQPSFDAGSSAERQFLDNVLVPTLGYPLLDYLRLQTPLSSLGLDPIDFGGQRIDFVLDTFRGVKLVIEVDGGQHQEPAQLLLDKKRDKALNNLNPKWSVWRVKTSELGDIATLQAKLRKYLTKPDGTAHWGVDQSIAKPRPRELMTCVWGATVAARIQFLLLQALREGILPWDEPWHVCIIEHDTAIGDTAVTDLADWFGRLREMYGLAEFLGIKLMRDPEAHDIDLLIDVAIIAPYRPTVRSAVPSAWSRPANEVAAAPKRSFTSRMIVAEDPSEDLITAFVQDWFRKTKLRDGQKEIIGRILRNQDVIGLLPTGGGKSLTYHLCGLLRGGMTIYVSPLKSLLQDQRERLIDCGIDLAVEISSALTLSQKAVASQQLIVGGVRFLLVSPERFLIDQFRVDLSQFRAQWGEVSQVVIDECHCVSEWGHDFRPAYLSLSRIVKDRTNRLGVSAPLVALTGTASSIVLADVRRELGVVEDGSVIRAKKLDRPEIDMSCVRLPQKQKHERIQQLVHDFVINATGPQEGLLVFCRFIGSTEGVLNITSELLGSAPPNGLRFYCGKNPDWRKFAAFRTKIKAVEISEKAAINVVPVWALASEGQLAQWEQVKSKVQRDFISGLKEGFPVLVATTAFGMGIDKPSVRKVIHVMTPQSPEAYYQEVGRAGRDKISSQAVLLFSDEDAEITDRILSPGATIDEARLIYEDFKKKNKFGGGDFIRTFYFHQNSFLGTEHEIRHIVTLLNDVRKSLVKNNSLIFQYKAGDGNEEGAEGVSDGLQEEKNLEYATVRLIILGVVKDYTKDYNGKTLALSLHPDWESIRDDATTLADYYADHFRSYVQKYQVNIEAKGEQKILEAPSVESIDKETATAIVTYVYEQIERKRREASRQMLELARKGISDQQGFRQALMLYLQVSEKFTQDLEELAKDAQFLSWKDFLDRVDTPDEILELHGACQRIIESYPTHSGLRAISAVTRRNPSDDEMRRSEEEFDAALQFCEEFYGKANAKALGDAIVDYVERTDIRLTDGLQGAFGKWLMRNGFMDEARQRFFVRKPVRNTWIASVLKEVNATTPVTRGL